MTRVDLWDYRKYTGVVLGETVSSRQKDNASVDVPEALFTEVPISMHFLLNSYIEDDSYWLGST